MVILTNIGRSVSNYLPTKRLQFPQMQSSNVDAVHFDISASLPRPFAPPMPATLVAKKVTI